MSIRVVKPLTREPFIYDMSDCQHIDNHHIIFTEFVNTFFMVNKYVSAKKKLHNFYTAHLHTKEILWLATTTTI